MSILKKGSSPYAGCVGENSFFFRLGSSAWMSLAQKNQLIAPSGALSLLNVVCFTWKRT